MLIKTITEELNEKLEEGGSFLIAEYSTQTFVIHDNYSGERIAVVPLAAHCFSQCEIYTSKMTFSPTHELYRLVDRTIQKILKTPATKLTAEEKYVVQPPQFNSSRGAQLLSTDGSGRVFFAAQKHGLKQSFTNSELQGIINQLSTVDGDTSWLTSMILSCKKLVE